MNPFYVQQEKQSTRRKKSVYEIMDKNTKNILYAQQTKILHASLISFNFSYELIGKEIKDNFI